MILLLDPLSSTWLAILAKICYAQVCFCLMRLVQIWRLLTITRASQKIKLHLHLHLHLLLKLLLLLPPFLLLPQPLIMEMVPSMLLLFLTLVQLGLIKKVCFQALVFMFPNKTRFVPLQACHLPIAAMEAHPMNPFQTLSH